MNGRGLLLVLGLAAVVLVAGCTSDDGDDAADGGTTVTTSAIVSELVETGEQVCTDAPDDVTTSAEAEVPPPVPQPGADILSVTSTLDEEEFTTTFELAGEPDVSGDYLISVGLLNDYDGGFEIQMHVDAAGVWRAETTLRVQGTSRATPLPDAEVFVGDSTLDLVVPRVALQPIGRDQPLLYGTSTVVREGGSYLDGNGEPTTDAAAAARALDDCITFGQ